MHGFSIIMQCKIIFRIKCKLPFFLVASKNIDHVCVMWSCSGNFLIRARDCDVLINNFCTMSQFQSRSTIFLKFIIILGVKLVLTNIIL